MKTNKFKRLIISVISIVMIFSTMTSCGQDVNSDNSSTAASVADDNSSEKDTMAIDINVSRENGESISETDSSEDDSMTTSTTKASDSSEEDDSSKTESTTKKTDNSSNGETTSKSTSVTTKITSNTTSKTISQSTTKNTTKSTTTTTKSTTKQTTKTTSSASSSTTKPTGLTRLESAVWEMSFWNYNEKYLKIVREELIKYGQAFCKQRNAPKYQVNSKMYPYYDKNGKPLYAPCDEKGNVIAVGSMVEFPYDEHFVGSNYKTSEERLSGCRAFINGMYLYIERVICNSFRHGLEDMQWNITYGFEPAGICWTVMTGFPDDWK